MNKLIQKYINAMFLMVFLTAIFPGTAAAAIQDQDDLSAAVNDTIWYMPNLCAKGESAGGGITLSLRDQIAQQLFVQLDSAAAAKTAVGTYHVGGILPSTVWLGGHISSAMSDAKAAKTAFATAPAFIGIDQEGGKIDRLKLTPSASAEKMGTMSTSSVQSLATTWGKKMKEYGVDVDFAPVADINQPGNAIISKYDRAFSSNPSVIADKAGAFATGLEKSGIIPTFKHFPGNGRSSADPHKGSATTPPLSELKSLDLKPYETLLNNPTRWVMIGNLNVPGINDLPEAPAALHAGIYNLLRKDYKFNGIAITDDLGSMKAVTNRYTTPQAVEMAIKAGATMALFTDATASQTNVKATIDQIERDAKSDSSLKSKIEANATAILKAKGVSDGKGSGSAGSVKLIGKDNVEKAFNYFMQRGLSAMQSAAIIGNLMQESGVNPRAAQPGGKGRGIAQWSTGDRWDSNPKGNMVDFGAGKFASTDPAHVSAADRAKGGAYDLGNQLDFIWFELNTNFKSVFDSFKKQTTLYDAASVFGNKYEIFGIEGGRQKYATEAFDKYGKNVVGPATSSTTSSGISACGGDTNGAVGIDNGFAFPQQTTQSKVKNNPGSRWCYQSLTSCHHDYKAADVMAPEGTINVASKGGKVLKAVTPSCNGGLNVPRVQIKGDDGVYYYYTHMKTVTVHEGQQVKTGDPIGQVGPTQCAQNTPPHLHFQMSSVPVNSTSDPAEQAKYIDPQPNLIAAFKKLPEK